MELVLKILRKILKNFINNIFISFYFYVFSCFLNVSCFIPLK